MLKYGFFHSTVKKCKAWCLALSLTVLFVLGATMQDAYAALNCTVQPTCEELGYGKDYLACPFDSSYIKNLSDEELFPAAKSCADMGFTTDDKSSWCPADKIVSCCDSEDDAKGTYTLCASVSCTDLGYTTDDKTEECATEELEKCPFDETYTRCPGTGGTSPSCTDLGFTTDDKTAWCAAENIVKCASDETYTLCKSATTPSCADLGFTTDDKTNWCSAGNLVVCPYDETYTLCNRTPYCPAGWAIQVGDCGTQGMRGWSLDTSISIEGSDCHPCVANDCSEGTSISLPTCEDGESVYGILYSGDSLCMGCTTIPSANYCPPGTYMTLADCLASGGSVRGVCVKNDFGCYEFQESELQPAVQTCSNCTTSKPYLCDGVCTATGDHRCLQCFMDDVERPVVDQPGDDDDDSGSNTSGGGGVGNAGSGGFGGGLPAFCEPGIDYCKLSPTEDMFQRCCRKNDDVSSSVSFQ